jgi:hypothetical protein
MNEHRASIPRASRRISSSYFRRSAFAAAASSAIANIGRIGRFVRDLARRRPPATQTFATSALMSAVRGKAVSLCSARAFPSLTPTGSLASSRYVRGKIAVAFILPASPPCAGPR